MIRSSNQLRLEIPETRLKTRADVFFPSYLSVPEDLSLEERDELSNIRRRKRELLDDIERLKFEIAEVMTEIEQLTCVGER
ncbi:Cytohesin-3 [Goodea atripinnis]|uniref:Cytohesin-3 n=1 Tax=Goodea atripinnis TaxID=208336 RepID=A0ABV0PFR3_9TELE